MKNWGRWGFWGVAALAGLLGGSVTQASESSKIYLNGEWVSAESPAHSGANHNIFGPWLGEEAALNPVALAQKFLEANSALLHLDASTILVPTQTQAGEAFQSQRLEKFWNGILVHGGDAVVHLSLGEVLFANADSTPLTHLSPNARLSAAEAQAIAYASYRGAALAAGEPELKVLLLGKGESREARLVYEVTVNDRDQFSSDIHFIDANSGAELMVSTNVHTLANRKVMAGLGGEEDFALDEDSWKLIYSDKGCGSQRFVAESTAWSRGARSESQGPRACSRHDRKVMASADSAWRNSGLVHEYFHKTHSRNSIDGRGMELKSVVNFGGAGFPNAAWYNDKALMLYGMGDDDKLNDFAAPLDVAAHEITHGVTSRTSALEYVSESGALNESYSDVFGKLVSFQFSSDKDWKLGKDLYKQAGKFVRDMENPEVAHVRDFRYKDQFCSRLNDFCGVHSNSGIPNRAAVLLAKKIGLEKLGKIYYLTLTQLLRKSSDFREAKAQTEAACGRLYGKGSSDCRAVREAFSAVGI